MSVWTYIRGHLASLIIGVLTCAALWVMLRLVGQGVDLAVFFTLVVALAFTASGVANYLHERSLYRELQPIAASQSDALELAAELRDPGTPLGDMACAAVHAVRTQAQVRVGEAAARERDHREFVEAWVHEVKTPLAAADLMVENLDDSRLLPLAHELDRVAAYVEQALYYARSSSVENDYLVRTCTLSGLVGAAVKGRASELVRAGVGIGMEGLDRQVFTDPKWIEFVLGQLIDNAVRYRCADGPRSELVRAGVGIGMEGLDRQVFTDPKWIEFVLGQLIDNAVRYRCADGPRIDFSARVEGEGLANESVVLNVRDNGCGISTADVGRVFDKGFTGENGRAFARSTGIGLYLVRTLCEKMGLAVSIASVQGEWTCVSIAFPTNRMRLIAD